MRPEVALPREALLEEAVVVAGAAAAADLGEVVAQAVLEERADLVPEGLVLGRESQVHRGTVPPDLTVRQISVVELRKRNSRRELPTTNREDAAMAPPAISGLRNPNAARGIAATL